MDEPIREEGVEFDIKKTKKDDDEVVGITDPVVDEALEETEGDEDEDGLDMEEADPFGDRFEE